MEIDGKIRNVGVAGAGAHPATNNATLVRNKSLRIYPPLGYGQASADRHNRNMRESRDALPCIAERSRRCGILKYA
ncbi:MAG: hypothetical protein M1482_17205 [Chloroflexi bacterium]|nr:hypothetical protein [Chloroflexota bacterium]